MINEPRSLQGPGEAYGWEEAPDLTSISEEELRARLKELAEEERAVRYRWRVLQGRIDLIGAELVPRGGARVLLGASSRLERGEKG